MSMDLVMSLLMETGSFDTDVKRSQNELVKLEKLSKQLTKTLSELNQSSNNFVGPLQPGKLRPVVDGIQSMNSAVQKSQAGFRNMNQIVQNTSYQITDFVVQVTGGVSAMRAFSQQAPQFLGAFGGAGAMLGVFAALAGAFAPIVVEAINGASALKTFDDAQKQLDETLGQVGKTAQTFDLKNVIEQFNKADAKVRESIVNLIQYEQRLLSKNLMEAGEALKKDLKDITDPSFLQRAAGNFDIGNPLGLDKKVAQDFYAEIRSGTTEATILFEKYGSSLQSGNDKAQKLAESLRKVAIDTRSAANASTEYSKFLDQAQKAGVTGIIPTADGKTSTAKKDDTLEKMFNNQRVGADKFVESMQKANKQVEFQSSLLGKSSQEVEILNAQYRIQAELEKTIQDIERQNGTIRTEEFERMKSAAAEALAIQTNAIMARQEMERSASYGIERSMKSYAESAGNAAKGIESVFSNAFKGMENALVQFAMTGKMNFGDMVNAMIADLIRFQMQMALAGLAKMAISAFAGSAAGGGMSSSTQAATYGGAKPMFGFSDGGYTGDGGKYQPAGVVHAGEFVMNKQATSRIGVGNLYKMMRGYADGGLVGSAPLAGGGNAGNVNINIKNEAGGDGYQATATARKNESGLDVEILVRKVMGDDLRRNGPMSQQMTNTFGLRRAM